jgi:hypothetical protein
VPDPEVVACRAIEDAGAEGGRARELTRWRRSRRGGGAARRPRTHVLKDLGWPSEEGGWPRASEVSVGVDKVTGAPEISV